MRRRLLQSVAVGTLVACLALSSQANGHAASLTFSLTKIGAFGGEPSITSDGDGVLYSSTPSGVPNPNGGSEPGTWHSFDRGQSWRQIESPDPASGDDCVTTDQERDLYWCNLNGSAPSLPLQADVWKSPNADTPFCSTGAGSCKWVHGAGTLGTTCGTSCSPFGVDRQWTAASDLEPNHRPAGYTGPEVAIMYHDFYGPSQIWINISEDGGKTFGMPSEVLANTSPAGAVIAQGYTMCNTVPAGIGIVPPGLPHSGRIYVSWIAADAPTSLGTGCNITMVQAFHTAWIAYSDDNGSTWAAQQAFDAGPGHDMSTPFVAFTLDAQGNPYIAFDTPSPVPPPGLPNNVPAICHTESLAMTVQADPQCSYRTFVVWSADGGNTWDGGGGLIGGSAAAAYAVDPGNQPGTDVFPAIAAGNPGQVVVAWLHTSVTEPTDALGKFLPGACSGTLPVETTHCDWFLDAAQSTNLTQSPSNASFTTTQVTAHPMHNGDVCNLGIFCTPNLSDRTLLDFQQATIDPTTGCAHISYPDNNSAAAVADMHAMQSDTTNPSPFGDNVVSANQTSGCIGALPVLEQHALPFTAGPAHPLPAVAIAVTGAGVLLLFSAWFGPSVMRRRRRRAH